MASAKTAIAWTDSTWSPTTGCDQTSPGCDNCYALKMAGRLKLMGSARYQMDGDPRTSGPGFALQMHHDALEQVVRWTKPRRIFVNSMSDLFHKDVTDGFIDQVFAAMMLAPQHTFQVLTKRSKRMMEWANYDFLNEDRGVLIRDRATTLTRHWGWKRPVLWDSRVNGPENSLDAHRARNDPNYERRAPVVWPLPNVELGVSVETDRYVFRADHLRATPAATRFLSCEPLLGPLPSLDLTNIDQVIVGGESGNGVRPMYPGWVDEIQENATNSGTAFFFKQTGTVLAKELGLASRKGDNITEVPVKWRVQNYKETK